MPTTSNFGWTTPADTDLVKDGALAIRTLGNGIDTSMAQLKGGTTGQVLSKTSNTDMAFTWVTQDDANAIQNAIVDAKGDLIAATANDTPARLAVGNNGETLVADSSASTGLRWQGSYAAGKNIVINGAFDFWQRGTSVTTSSGYNADRWAQVSGNSIVHSRSTDVPSNLGFNYSMSMAGTGSNITTRIESLEASRFAGQTITVSFYYKSTAGADALNYALYYANSADNFGAVTQIGSTQTVSSPSTSWVRVSTTFTSISANASNGLALYINRGAGATATTLITGVQIELGSVATAFSKAGGTLAGELAACQRYYEKSYNQATAPANGAGGTSYNYVGAAYGTGNVRANVQFKVSKRVAPTLVFYRTTNIASDANWAYFSGGWVTATSSSATDIKENAFAADLAKTATFTTGYAYILDGEWAASAEL